MPTEGLYERYINFYTVCIQNNIYCTSTDKYDIKDILNKNHPFVTEIIYHHSDIINIAQL
ncbi:MAG: hypothetical protein IJ150_12190 [Bacteroidales bacterium]|nr:hypothetical protein [Bacteroidales bacterium]